jgi:predicted Fe-Mo cluster-binding NifX family protein
MKLAIPVSNGRVSPAFDFARQVLLLECERGREATRAQLVLEEGVPVNRARRLASLGVKLLICGAISSSLAEHLVGAGVDIMPFVSGTVEEVLAAYLAGELDSTQFLMPGSTVEEREKLRLRRETHAPATLARGRN